MLFLTIFIPLLNAIRMYEGTAPMGKPFFWNELNSSDFANLDPEKTIAILPIASTEQHGPHLPISTDVTIGNSMLAALREQLPDHLAVLVLPTQEIGKANEHVYGPGTLSLGAEILIPAWTAIGTKVAEAGLRKMIIMNSHGGNVDIMNIVSRELRVRCAMAVIATQWSRFGIPAGLCSERELKFGIHGGDMETSLMLYFRPDLVRMDKAQDFVSNAEWMQSNFKHIQPVAPHPLAWIAHDLNVHGVVGDASIATAEKGRIICRHQVEGFIELLEDLTSYPLSKLFSPPL
jgi:creatinine amidohydrolase